MKYFKYTLWDNGDYKYSFLLRGDGSSINQINMPLFGEINNGKNYDLITGEEITYCAHPYSGSLSFSGYELTSAADVEFFLNLMKPQDIINYKKFINRVKSDSLKESPELAQSRFIAGGELPDYKGVKTLVNKIRKLK